MKKILILFFCMHTAAYALPVYYDLVNNTLKKVSMQELERLYKQCNTKRTVHDKEFCGAVNSVWLSRKYNGDIDAYNRAREGAKK